MLIWWELLIQMQVIWEGNVAHHGVVLRVSSTSLILILVKIIVVHRHWLWQVHILSSRRIERISVDGLAWVWVWIWIWGQIVRVVLISHLKRLMIASHILPCRTSVIRSSSWMISLSAPACCTQLYELWEKIALILVIYRKTKAMVGFDPKIAIFAFQTSQSLLFFNLLLLDRL